jgi:hypothetical protein
MYAFIRCPVDPVQRWTYCLWIDSDLHHIDIELYTLSDPHPGRTIVYNKPAHDLDDYLINLPEVSSSPIYHIWQYKLT